jgi:arabinogalactan endo-1,4-beta-galactosidase
MKKIVRLTESDITRIIRRVINENDENDLSPDNSKQFSFVKKATEFLSAVDNDGDDDYEDFDGTNDKSMQKVIMSIISKEEYDDINNYVIEKTKKSVINWIKSETDYDLVQVGNHTLKMFCHLVSLGVTVNGYDELSCKSKLYKDISCVDRMSLPNAEGDFNPHRTSYGNIRNIDGNFDLYQGSHFFCRIK